jgi:CheY-like chemotaxis protein
VASSSLVDARVLVVDDDASNRLLLHTLLISLGVEQVRLSDGDEPLGPLVQELDPDLVLLDLNIGGSAGWTCCATWWSTIPGGSTAAS